MHTRTWWVNEDAVWASEDVLLRKLEYLCPKPPRTVRLFQLEQGRQHIEVGVMLRDLQVKLVRELANGVLAGASLLVLGVVVECAGLVRN